MNPDWQAFLRNATFRMLSDRLPPVANRGQSKPGSAAIPAGWQSFIESQAKQKAAGKELVAAASAFCEELIRWARDAERPEPNDDLAPQAEAAMAAWNRDVSAHIQLPPDAQLPVSIKLEKWANYLSAQHVDLTSPDGQALMEAFKQWATNLD